MKFLIAIFSVVCASVSFAENGDVQIAWPAVKGSKFLVVPESDGRTIASVTNLAFAYCSESGKLPVKFEKHQNPKKEQSTQGMPLDSRIAARELRGARFKIRKGKLRDAETCLLTSRAFASEFKFVRLKPDHGEFCENETVKKVTMKVLAAKNCVKKASTKGFEIIEFENKSTRHNYVGILGDDIWAAEDLGVTTAKSESDVQTHFQAKFLFVGKHDVKIVSSRSSHETSTITLDQIKFDKLKPLVKLDSYNSSGG